MKKNVFALDNRQSIMFKYNYDFHEMSRRARRLFDGKLTYRKLLVVLIFSCLFFLWLLSRFFGSNNKSGPKGRKVTRCRVNQSISDKIIRFL